MRPWIKTHIRRRKGKDGVIRYEIFYLRKAPELQRGIKRVNHPDMGPVTGRFPTAAMIAEREDEAAHISRQWELQLNSRANEAVIPMPLVTAAQRFILWARENRKPGTVDRYDLNLRRFVAWVQLRWNTRNMSGLRTSDYATYRDHLSDVYCGGTVNCVLHDLSSWNNWALGESLIVRNYAVLVNKVRAVRDADGHETGLMLRGAEELWNLLDVLETDFHVAVTGMLACTGMRIDELRWLRWDNSWDTRCETLAIGARMEDTSTKRHGRLHPLCNIVRHYLMMLKCIQDPGSPYVCGAGGGWKRLTSQVGNWLKPHGLRPKDMRRWFRSSLVTVARVNKMGDCTVLINDLCGHMMKKTRSAYECLEDIEGTTPLMERFSEWLLAARPLGKVYRMSDEEAIGSGYGALPTIPDEEF